MKHIKFIARTILCQNNQVDACVKSLQKVLAADNIIRTAKRWESYEKPYQRRNRLSFESCRSIYNEEMQRKIQFIVRKNRQNAHPWE